jgi:predicted RNA-binding protein with TRAM domain
VNGAAFVSVGTALTANITGLTAGTSYTVQVRANNSAGAGPASSASFPTLPPAPGTPTFSSITGTTATASWTAAAGVVSSYAYSINGGAYTSVGTALSVNLTGLSIGTSYTISVSAANASGNGAASSGSFTTVALPGAPSTPTFSNVIVTTATASWTAASGTVTSYSYSLNGGAWTNAGNVLATNLTGLTAGTTYSVQIQATNAAGNGPASSAGSFTTHSTYTDTPVLTIGSTLPAGTSGFLAGSFGAISPTTTSNGFTYTQFYDKWAGGQAQTYSFSAFAVSGFSADPGQAWLTSVTGNNKTFTGASATYSYSAGTATWTWHPAAGFGFDSPATNNTSIIHK